MRIRLIFLASLFLLLPQAGALSLSVADALATTDPLPEVAGVLAPLEPTLDAMPAPPTDADAVEERTHRATSIGEAIIGFRPNALPSVRPGDDYHGMEVVQVEPRGDFLVVSADDLDSVRTALHGVTDIAYIEDNGLSHALVVPDDARYGEQYGPEQLGAENAWGQIGYGSSDVVVAVLDTGIRRTHQDFESSRILQGYDYSNGDTDPNDDCDHGTHVSGTIGATTNNGIGVAGVSQASILPMKVLSPFIYTCSGSASDIAAAMYDATDQGARILSMSLGGGGSSTEENAVNYAWNNGALVVAAAGNDGSSNSVDHPAAYANAIAVGSITQSGSLSSFSDRGPEVEVVAAGSDVLSTTGSGDSAYATMSGTSMATPHVSGALALALSCDPSLTNQQLRTLMQQTAQDLGSAGRDNSFGYGLIRVDSIVQQLSCGGGGPDTTAPLITVTSPDLGGTYGGSVTITADIEDASPLDWARARLAGGDWVWDSYAPHQYTFDTTGLADGDHALEIQAQDNAGNLGTWTGTLHVSNSGDPDPSTTTMENGQTYEASLSEGGSAYGKILVPSDAGELVVEMAGPACGLFGCSFDADLYVQYGERPTDSIYDCRPYQSGSDESCTITDPTPGWWYVRAHAYSGSGTVTLTATHDGGGPANQAPTASFTWSADGLAAAFDGSGSSDPDGDILTYGWDFGDGATGSGVAPSHTYAAGGDYSVTLTVDDGQGGSDSATNTVTVTATGDLAGYTLVVDAGHGGDDPGAQGNGLDEKDLNLDVALRLRDLLESDGATVLMTRTTDVTVSLADRVALANDNGADRFISVHTNSCGGCGGTGSETYYHDSLPSTSTAADLSTEIQTEAVQHTGLRDRGVKQANFYVLRETSMPATLHEMGFIDTADDAAYLGSTAGRQAVAEALWHGIRVHLGYPVEHGGDPDPSTQTLQSGTTYEVTLSEGEWAYGKVYVPAGSSAFDAVLEGPACGLLGCSSDADLYVQYGARPDTGSYDCRPYETGSDEDCTFSSPQEGWWYIGVHGYSGSGTVDLTPTVS